MEYDTITRLEDARRRKQEEEFARAFRDRKGCRHRLIPDKEYVAGLVSVIEQLSAKGTR